MEPHSLNIHSSGSFLFREPVEYNTFRTINIAVYEGAHPMPRNLHSPSTALTAARQTMAAWSKVIECREDIPVFYKHEFDRYFESARRFPYVVLTPSLDKYPRNTNEKLACDSGDSIYIFEKDGDHIETVCFPYRDICDVELGIILLDSWLTISGKTASGKMDTCTLAFNTTSLRHFAGILNKLRSAPEVIDSAQLARERDKFDYLSAVNFKFMNSGRESLLPGETVLQILFQPEIRQPLLTLFGRLFYKTISPAHLAAITDRELILIRDAERGRKSQISRYGGVWQYLPLSCIDRLTLSETAEERSLLSIQCNSGKTIEKLFEASNRAELQQFCAQLQTLIDRAHASRRK